jgi:hypothetical protein
MTWLDRLGGLIGWLGVLAGFGISAVCTILTVWGLEYHEASRSIAMTAFFAVAAAVGSLWALAKRRT